MPLLPLCVFMTGYRVKLTFTFTKCLIIRYMNIAAGWIDFLEVMVSIHLR